MINEGVKFDLPNLVKIIKDYGSDMRRIINQVQLLTSNGELGQYTTNDENQENILNLIKTKKFTEARKYIGEHSVNIDGLIKYLMNNAKELTKERWIEVVVELGEIAYRTKVGVDPEIAFMAGLATIMQLY